MRSYWFSPLDLDVYAFRDYPRLPASQVVTQQIVPDLSGKLFGGVRRCPRCGELIDKWNETLQDLKVKKRRLDLGVTYDGIWLASSRFKEVFDASDLSGLEFKQLPMDPEFFSIRPVRAVAFDAERRGTRFIKQCPECLRFESVVGATPVQLCPGTVISPREFVRSDLEFGSEDEKSPVVMCGESAADVLKSSSLKGIALSLYETS